MAEQNTSNEIKQASFFIVAALSPSFLISLICVLLYLFTAFPELKEPVSHLITSLLMKAGVKSSEPTANSEK